MWPFGRKQRVKSKEGTRAKKSHDEISRELSDHARRERITRPVLDNHFAIQERIQAAYKRRDEPGQLATAIRACEEQIARADEAAKVMRTAYQDKEGKPLPLPRHVGYEQLAVVREKQGDIAAALRLSREAQRKAWNGDWKQRIERLEGKQKKGTG